MNESCWSFLSVSVMLRPAQNTSQSSSGPPRRTGVSTVIAVAFPSTFATGQPYPAGSGRWVDESRRPLLERALWRLRGAYRHARERLAADPLQIAQVRQMRGPDDAVIGVVGQADRVAMCIQQLVHEVGQQLRRRCGPG